MSRLLEEYKDIYSGFLERARTLIIGGEWHLKENRQKFKLKKEDFDHTQNAAEAVVDALEALISSVEEERHKPGIQPYINEVLSTINIHLDRITKYYTKNNPKGFKTKESQREEATLQQHYFKGEQKIKSKLKSLNIENDMSSFSFEFFNDVKATIPMKEILATRFPDIAAKIESLKIDWDLILDNELFINKKKKDIPEWNEKLHFWDQEEETLQFWVSEYNKIKNGIEIDGVKIIGWLYYHINYFKTPIGDEGDAILTAPLRDNEWYLCEMVKYVQDQINEGKDGGLAIMGTRRFGKSSGEASWSCFSILINPTKNGVIASSAEKDILALADKVDIAVTYLPPAFQLPINSKDWTKQVRFGLKTKSSQEIKYFYLDIINIDSGSKRGSQKLAGIAPILFVMDEFAKEKFIASYNALIPALETNKGWKTIPWYTACLTAGNKVFTKEGNLINIEDLKKENGIIGYNLKNKKVSDENIERFNPPQEKECYEIKTNKGTVVEASFDHPFYIKHRDKVERVEGKQKRKTEFLEVENIKEGMYLSLPKIIPLKGNKAMVEDPYYIGAIIGDGNYSSDRGVRFFNEDDEIWDYFDSIGKKYKITKSYITKKGRFYREARLYGTMKHLKTLGIYGQSKEKKDLPKDIHLYKEDQICNFIAGLFDTDGMVQCDKNIAKISVSQISENLIDNLKLLLIRIGIHSNKYEKQPYNSENSKIISKSVYYTLDIQDKHSMEIFIEKIPLKIKRKKEKLKELKEYLKNKKSRIDSNHEDLRFERIISVKRTGIKPVYNLTTTDTHTYLANGVITHNTGGDEDLSAEAEKALADPKSHRFVEMDWNILNKMVPKEFRTWEERPFGFFIPAQMGQRTGHIKNEKTLSDFLGLKSKELDKVKIQVTDWEINTKVCLQKREDLKKDRTQLQKEIVYYPLDPEECFMSAKSNPFPAQNIKTFKEKLISEHGETGIGRPIELYRDEKDPTKIKYRLSTKEVPKFPATGGFVDAPFVLYDDFPETRPDRFRFVAGLDDYKHEESDGDSIGSFCIFDRLKQKIVLSLSTRPDPHSNFHTQIHMALDAWNAICFPENEDMDIKKYFDRLHMSDYYLGQGFDVMSQFNIATTGKRKYGWQPDKITVPFVRGLVIEYTKHQSDILDNEDNVVGTKLGLERIPDPELLEEMIKYKEGGNYDRLVAFGSALLYDHYLRAKYIIPQKQPERDEQQDNSYQKPKSIRNKVFTKSKRRLF